MWNSAKGVYVYTRSELLDAGLVDNPHMPLGVTWMFCLTCMRNAHHYPMSHPGQADCFEICEKCQTYTGVYRCREIDPTPLFKESRRV